jgi:hypothetical protein
MLFPENKKISLSKNECVKVVLHEGNVIYGIVEDIQGDVVWLRSSPSEGSKLARFNFKIDRFFKLN